MLSDSIMGNLKKFEPKKRQFSSGEAQSLLKEEIVQLQKELEGQTKVRSMLEKALDCQPLLDDPTYKSLSQPAEDLIKEIALLELEVVYLEKYLLSLYRKSFAKKLSVLPTLDQRSKVKDQSGNGMCLESDLEALVEESDPLIDSGIYRTHSSLSQHSASSPRLEDIDAYHSLPLSMLERTHESSSINGETPNWLSEEMIKCISTIYFHLSHPHQDNSSLSPFHVEFSATFFPMVEIRGLARDSQNLNSVQDLLQNYKSLISRLGQVDPGKLNHEEKLAFWINVHNALVMHAFLVYGIPRGTLKRISSVLKAAYNIGGHTVSVDTIQCSILRCRLPRPSLWLHSLFLPKTKFKAGDARRTFAVKFSEPRLHFALCFGCQSDPPVRLYTAKKVYEELEMGKEEYMQMNIKLHKEQRLIIPKNVEYYTKEMGLSQSGITEMLEHSMPADSWRKVMQGKLWKKLESIPHSFTFRFLLSNELVR